VKRKLPTLDIAMALLSALCGTISLALGVTASGNVLIAHTLDAMEYETDMSMPIVVSVFYIAHSLFCMAQCLYSIEHAHKELK
jgi:hypothetical protein